MNQNNARTFDFLQYVMLRIEVVAIQFFEFLGILVAFFYSVQLLSHGRDPLLIPLIAAVNLWLQGKLAVMQHRLGHHVKQLEARVYATRTEALRHGWEHRKEVTASPKAVGFAGVLVVLIANLGPIVFATGYVQQVPVEIGGFSLLVLLALGGCYYYATKPKQIAELPVDYDTV